MKATGIVRRIDDLGRVVIPKEIRRTLRLHEGTPLEILHGSGRGNYTKKILSHDGTDRLLLPVRGGHGPEHRPDGLHHRQRSGHRRIRRSQKGLSAKIHQPPAGSPDRRAPDCDSREGRQRLYPHHPRRAGGATAQVVVPIICEGDAIGSVILLSREPRVKFSETELKLASTAAGFLGRQMEG